jgi:hypothetical protein
MQWRLLNTRDFSGGYQILLNWMQMVNIDEAIYMLEVIYLDYC